MVMNILVLSLNSVFNYFFSVEVAFYYILNFSEVNCLTSGFVHISHLGNPFYFSMYSKF